MHAAVGRAEPDCRRLLVSQLEKFGGKPGCVVCEPATRTVPLDGNVLCFVLSSDGVWDNVAKVGDLSSTVKTSVTQAANVKKAAAFAAESVVMYSLRRTPNMDGQDNTSAVVVVVGPEAEAALAMS